jgi:hypothetical protein
MMYTSISLAPGGLVQVKTPVLVYQVICGNTVDNVAFVTPVIVLVIVDDPRMFHGADQSAAVPFTSNGVEFIVKSTVADGDVPFMAISSGVPGLTENVKLVIPSSEPMVPVTRLPELAPTLPPVGASPQMNPPLGVFVVYNTLPFAAG